MRSHTRFLNLTVDAIRRELVSYGAAVSNVAESAKLQRLRIASLAAYTADLLDRNAPTSNQEPESQQEPCQLPNVALKLLSAHKCLCLKCPEYEA